MVRAATGGCILRAGGWSPAHVAAIQPRDLAMFTLAGVAMYLVNTTSVSVMVGLQSGRSPLRFWYQAVRNADRIEHLVEVGQVGLGLLAAMVADLHPWALSLLAIPVIALYFALERHLRFGKQIGEAQRIARFGDWVWDLDTGAQVWSDEMYRIFGFAPQAFVPGYETFLAAVHPDDRARVNRDIHEALATGARYGLDHRILLPDGTVRIVHEQGEVVSDVDRPRRLVVTVHDVTERKALEERLAHQAFHDALTGLPNRAFFLDRLQHALAHPVQGGPTLAVIFLDLDRFKVVNDGLGHAMGDQLLVAVAERLRACVGPEESVARFGGDEFTVLLPRVADPATACRVAERAMEALQAPFMLGGHEVCVTTSAGIALHHPKHGAPADLLRDADIALYRAKEDGKARYVVFDPGMVASTPERLDLEADLRRAIDRDELRIVYQPIVDIPSGEIVQLEALLRWEHPQHGLLAPGQFIPLAEETGLILPIGQWVLEETCRAAKAWQTHDPDRPPVTVSVNLSATQLQQPTLVDAIAEILRRVELDPTRLMLELTENIIMADTAGTMATIRHLRSLGVQLAIDDFGTGYSSLAYLGRFPVDMLKLDKSFVDGLGRERADTAIVRAVVALGQGLGLKTVAEGVESARQLAELRLLGCTLGQGYYFGKPAPAEAIDALLAERMADHATHLWVT